MVYMKYLLGQTGLFPKWEPKVEDVLEAIGELDEVKNIVTPRGDCYYYVIPLSYDLRSIHRMLRLFRANGVWLVPHVSRNYYQVVFRARNNGQEFLRDVMRVNRDIENFHKVLQERGIDHPSEQTLKAFEKLKYQQR